MAAPAQTHRYLLHRTVASPALQYQQRDLILGRTHAQQGSMRQPTEGQIVDSMHSSLESVRISHLSRTVAHQAHKRCSQRLSGLHAAEQGICSRQEEGQIPLWHFLERTRGPLSCTAYSQSAQHVLEIFWQCVESLV